MRKIKVRKKASKENRYSGMISVVDDDFISNDFLNLKVLLI